MPDLCETLRFGEFELDVAAYGLRRGGVSVKLERQPMDLLILLVERRQQLVSRSDIVAQLWGRETFIDVETGINTAISKIRHVLNDPTEAPAFVETISGKGYRFIAPVEVVCVRPDANPSTARQLPPVPSPPGVPERASNPPPAKETQRPSPDRWHRPWVVGSLAGIVVLALTAQWLLRTSREVPTLVPAMRVVQLTAFNGYEVGRVSPDGRHVLFEWTGEGRSNQDIYVQVVGSSDPHALTTDPADDVAPMWSSDGRQIAYVRRGSEPFSGHLRVMSSLGDSDRKVSDFLVAVPAVWSPDDRYLVAGRAPSDATPTGNGLYLIPVHGGQPRTITQPSSPGADRTPAFSPDGHRLAYVSCAGPSIRTACHVNVLDLDSTFAAAGTPRQVTQVPDTTIMGLTWTRDGQSVIYGAEELGIDYLWRIGVDGQRPPERIEMAGAGAVFPQITPGGDRLTFARLVDDDDIYRFEPGRLPQPVARSSVFDGGPEFSPDGQRIVFSSARAGEAVDVWTAGADGSAPAQLTHGPGRWQGSPAWSPNGREIAFESRAADGSWHIWTVDIQSGTQHPVTTDYGDQNMPTWSHDGEWIYFSWKQANARDFWQRDIWRVRVRTGAREQVTHGGGGYVGRESADGKTLLYQPTLRTSPVLAQPLGGGTPRPLITCVIGTAVAVTDTGIYYVPCSASFAPGQATPVRVWDPGTGKDREVGRLEQYHIGNLTAGFAVSPDGQTILYSRIVNSGADLMMIEHFR